MKVFICGQRSFGRAVLTRLIQDGHEITGAACPPPGKYYDKLHTGALGKSIPVIIPDDRLVASDIPSQTELLIAAHSHHFISKKARDRVSHGGIGYHPSLLPRHRGRDAVRWTIRFGDPITGGTVYRLDETVDGGPIILQEAIHVHKDWDHHDLWNRLFPLGVQLLSQAVKAIEDGSAVEIPQDEDVATWEPVLESRRLFRPELIQLP